MWIIVNVISVRQSSSKLNTVDKCHLTFCFVLLSQAAGAPEPDSEAAQKARLSCALALAILAAACRLPDVAASEEMRERLPLLLRVAQHGGAGAAMAAAQRSAAPRTAAASATTTQGPDAMDTAGDDEGDRASAMDAIECAAAVAASSAGAGLVALAAGGLEAAAAVLSDAAQRGAWLPATRLLGSIAEAVTAANQRSVLWEDEAPAAAAAVAALAGAMVAPPPAAGAGAAAAGGFDPAVVQLEGLHTLLLLLPPPEGCALHTRLLGLAGPSAAAAGSSAAGIGAATAAAGAARSAAGASGSGKVGVSSAPRGAAPWTACLHSVLNAMLRSRLGGTQKQSALQLAAAVVQMCGHEWVTSGRPGHGDGSSSAAVEPGAAAPARSDALLQVHNLTHCILVRQGLFY